MTGEQDGQVGHADEPATPGPARELGITGIGTLGEPVAPACPGTGTTGELVVPACPGTGTAGVADADGEGVAMTGGPTKKVEDAPASTGTGVEVELVAGTAGTTGVLLAGQFLTVGAQLVITSPMVLKAVASTRGAGSEAETCCWTWPSGSSLAKPAMATEPALKAARANE